MRKFNKKRYSPALLLPYLPVALLLVVFRSFLLINYIFSRLVLGSFLCPDHPVRKFISKVILSLLGQVYKIENQNSLNQKAVLISNHSTFLDEIIFGSLYNFSPVVKNDSGFFGKHLFNFIKISENTEENEKLIVKNLQNNKQVVVIPEKYPTNESSVLPFCDWPFQAKLEIQPIVLRTYRPFEIIQKTNDSSLWKELVWSLASLFTYYRVTVLKSCSKKEEENIEEFKERIRQMIAKELKVTLSTFADFNQQDLIEDTEINSMVQTILDVLPHVPRHVVEAELERTNSTDVTITNLLEGVLRLPDVAQNFKKPEKVKQIRDPLSISWTERKRIFLEEARERYIQKLISEEQDEICEKK